MPIDYHNDGANTVNAFLFLDKLKKTHNKILKKKKRKVKKKSFITLRHRVPIRYSFMF
jgi:hypothetical protein